MGDDRHSRDDGDDRDERDDRGGRAKRPVDHGHSPTQAFKQMPTEVLDLPPPDLRKLVDPNASTRRTAMQQKLFDDDDDDDDLDLHSDPEASDPGASAAGASAAEGFEDPYGTEVLGAHGPGADLPAALNPNVTAPEPFKRPLNSDMRALQEVARLPTAMHVPVDDGEPDGTDTSADAAEGEHDADGADDDENLFEVPTTGFNTKALVTSEEDSPFSETVMTDEAGAPSYSS